MPAIDRIPASAFAQVPEREGRAGVPQRRPQPPDGRQGASAGELGERGGEADTDAGQTAAPDQPIGVDGPGSLVAEGPEFGVRRRGHDPVTRHRESLWVSGPT